MSANSEWDAYYERERLIDREAQALWQAEVRRMAGVLYRAQRFLIRTLRIGAGLLLAIVAWVIYLYASDLLDVPFASLTLSKVAALVVEVILIWTFAKFAWLAAFGSGPTEAAMLDAIRTRVTQSVMLRERQQ